MTPGAMNSGAIDSEVMNASITDSPSGTMRAAVVVAPGAIEIQTVPIPEPGPAQVRMRVEGCGVCASNIPPWEGREWFTYPMEPGALGHEAWGTVDAVGAEVADLQVGDRATFLSHHSYAEYDVADASATIKMPPEMDGRAMPGEPLGCGLNVIHRAQIAEGDTVAIVGIGFLGALLVYGAKAAGARVIALDRKPAALEIARHYGADEIIVMDDHWKAVERMKELTEGRFAEVAIEVTGKEWPLNLAAEITGEYGRLVIAGYHQDGLRCVNVQLWNWRGLDVINAHERDPRVYRRGMQEAVAEVASGAFDPTPLFTHTLPLERLGEALEMARERPPGFMKALVTMADDGSR